MLKLWISQTEEPAEAERYIWNGVCLEMRMPDYITEISPTRVPNVRESINGKVYVSTQTYIERHNMLLQFTMTEKEKLAFEQFVYNASINTLNGFPHPHIYYSGLEVDWPSGSYYMTIMPEEITYNEYYSTEVDGVTVRKYKVDVAIRITKRIGAAITPLNQHIVHITWPEHEIYLAKETFKYKTGNKVVDVYGWISSLTGLSSTGQIDGFGGVGNVTVTIAAFNQYNDLDENHPMRHLDKHIETISEADIEIIFNDVVIFKGTPYTPYKWDSASYELSFDCVLNAKSDEIGFQPDIQDNPLLNLNTNWPHVFGSGVFDFTPFAKQPKTKLTADTFVTREYMDIEKRVFPSGMAFSLPIDPSDPVPAGEYTWLVPVEGGNIRLKGQAAGSTLIITEFNVPYLSDIITYQIEQYDENNMDRPDYQPATIISTVPIPDLTGKHIKATAWRNVWVINEQGAFVQEPRYLTYWATVIGQHGEALYLDDITDAIKSRDITLSGWKTSKIDFVMDNRLFEPGSYEMLPDEEVKSQRSTGKRKMYYDNQYLAIHIRGGSSAVCVDWLIDKIYPISLDLYTNVNNVFLDVDHLLYQVPVYSVWTFDGTNFVPKQYDNAPGMPLPGSITIDLEQIRAYMPEECTFMILYEHFESVKGDVVNDLTNDEVAFDFLISKYTDLEYIEPRLSMPVPTNFITRDKKDIRAYLGMFTQEHGKRIIVHTNRTVELETCFTFVDPNGTWTPREIPARWTFNESNIEYDSIIFDSRGIEDISNKLKLTSAWGPGEKVLYGDQRYPENWASYTISTWWKEEIWRHWINWQSKVWRKVTFKTFLPYVPSAMETITIETGIITCRAIVESVQIQDDLVTITAITESEVI